MASDGFTANDGSVLVEPAPTPPAAPGQADTMHPSFHAARAPDRPAIVMAGSGEVVTFGELDARSNAGAHVFRSLGLTAGSVVAILMDNNARYLEVTWAAQRAGLYYVCISSRLTASETEYILRDSGARVLVASAGVGEILDGLPGLIPGLALYLLGDSRPGFASWAEATARQPTTPIADERAGCDMLYSSGTTGRPKGVRPNLPANPAIGGAPTLTPLGDLLGFDAETRYLSPAPLYHAAPLRWCMLAQARGGTVIILEKFDAESALATIEKYRVTHSQWVPTHFIRLLKLEEDVRRRYDLSTLKVAIHAAAPCPMPVKRAMIEWWGPILFEYYGSTEGNGLTTIGSRDWLDRPGSVGRSALGIARICDDDGNPVPVRTEGGIYFEGGPLFVYHNDPEKTAAATNALGWTTFGDVGWLDEDGYLYLTDRRSFMIISGGVNIYPQEIENLLAVHPRIADVAVIGAPDPEMGEQVVAVVQPAEQADAGPAFAEQILAWLRPQLSSIKMPRRVDFMAELPRHPTGKLYKKIIRDHYWAAQDKLAG